MPRRILKHIWGDLMTESNFYSSILMNEKSGLQQKGHFSHPGQMGWCLSTTRALSVHVPVPGSKWVFVAPKKIFLVRCARTVCIAISPELTDIYVFFFLPRNNGGNAWGNHFAKIDRLIDWQLEMHRSGFWLPITDHWNQYLPVR